MILTDNETKVDLLNNEAIAKTIVGLIGDRPEQPVTIGVHGDWGAGKSSILEMIEAQFASSGDVLCLKFNGWRFQGFEDAKIALIEGIVTALIGKRPFLTKATDQVKAAFKRIDWLKVAKKAGGLALTAYTGIPTADQVNAIVSTLGGYLDHPEKLASKEAISGVIDGVRGILKPEESKNVPEEIEEFRKAFEDLLAAAKVKQLVVLIDDLDRCLPDNAIETLEAIRLFVFTSKTAFVVAADEAMIEYAVRKHFPDLPDSSGPRDYARNYLEKLIQVPFRIPSLGEMETRTYVTLLLTGAELGEGSPEFNKLISAARDRLRRPWTNGPLDVPSVKAAIGNAGDKVLKALSLSDQIGPILANGTHGNPRQIKRFLNALLLRHRTAVARGFGDDINVPVLAKLMLAERFSPRVFDQIASACAIDPKGHCRDLALLEERVQGTEKTEDVGPAAKAGKGLGVSKEGAKLETVAQSQDSATLTEWLSNSRTLSWAASKPSIGAVDLRPYLFVTKDRKDYFGALSALGPLATTVEQLLGPKLAVQGLELALKKLTQTEASRVHEAICSRITASDSIATEPAGAAGLSVLVKAHPTLQMSLLDFLESLPVGKVGPWVVSGWSGALSSSEANERFQRLLESWKTSGNQMLKATASAALKTSKGTP